MSSINQPPCCRLSHPAGVPRRTVRCTSCGDVVCTFLSWREVKSVPHLSRRTKRPGEVHSDEHAVQVQGEPQVSATRPGGQDPQNHRDQVHQSRLAIFPVRQDSLTVVNSAGAQCVWTTNCRASPADVEEKGVRMKLTVIDTPGFGDQINNENWWVEVL